MENDYVVVIGGLNLDLAGLAKGTYRGKDSNIGEVKINVGGVGHNIALNLTQLDVPTHLITVYGDDHFGEILYNETIQSGISLDYAEKIENSRSSIYLYVADDEGDMVTAINDMSIVDKITPELLSERIDFINNASICVLDANLSEEAIDWLAENVDVPIFVDPVSVAKVGRLNGVLHKVDTIKPNEHEVEVLTGIKVHDLSSAEEAARELNNKGVENAFISLGAKGILCSRNKEVDLVPPIAEEIVSTNGAGDTTMAALVWVRYLYSDVLPLSEVGLFTQSAACINLQSPEAVSPDLNVRNVVLKAQEYYEEV